MSILFLLLTLPMPWLARAAYKLHELDAITVGIEKVEQFRSAFAGVPQRFGGQALLEIGDGP